MRNRYRIAAQFAGAFSVLLSLPCCPSPSPHPLLSPRQIHNFVEAKHVANDVSISDIDTHIASCMFMHTPSPSPSHPLLDREKDTESGNW